MEFNIDNSKLYESLEYIKAVCIEMQDNGSCEYCPMRVGEYDRCGVCINTPDDWRLRKPDTYSAFV